MPLRVTVNKHNYSEGRPNGTGVELADVALWPESTQTHKPSDPLTALMKHRRHLLCLSTQHVLLKEHNTPQTKLGERSP